MLVRLDCSAPQIVSRYVDPAGRYALGRSSLGILSKSQQPAVARDGQLLVILDGELYDLDLLRADLRKHSYEVDEDDYAGALLATYAEGGFEAIAKLEGSFAAAVLNVGDETLTLISDGFGTRPLYYALANERFDFGSQIAAVLADASVSHDLDWQGLSQFFTFGHYFHDNTSLSAVKILPAGASLTFDARSKTVNVCRYWAGSNRVGGAFASRQAAFEAVDEALFDAVGKRSSSNGTGLALSLSGGLDARTILGVFNHPADRLQTVCLGMAGSRDHQASAQLAAIVGCSHRNHVLDAAFLSEFDRHLNQMVGLTDGQYLSQCIVMPTFPLYQELGAGVLLRGHGGELMHLSKAYNYSLDAEALQIRGDADLDAWLWKRLQAYLLDGVDGPLFARTEVRHSELARESLCRAIDETPSSEPPAQRIAHLFLDQRLRRETPLSLMKFRSVIEPRMPYMDRALVERLLAMPVEWKLDDDLQTFILRKRQPRFCAVENTNTGADLGAGKMRRSAATLKMKVFGKLGVAGYQPYERLGLWLRRELAPLVREVLLDDTCLDRGIFAPDTVRQVVERHLSGARNHTYLILALMIFETGHQALFRADGTRKAAGPGPFGNRIREATVEVCR
jgi:asparagine synthase (glutamine-hydrolysing)